MGIGAIGWSRESRAGLWRGVSLSSDATHTRRQ
jgi:hypothetical protein